MRRHLTRALCALALLCLLPLSALAIDVTIAGQSFAGYNYGGATATVRFYASDTFTTTAGDVIGAGQVGSSAGFFRSMSCTVAGTTLTCPAVTLPATTDSPDLPQARWTAVLFDAQGTRRNFFPLSDFKLSHTLGISTTWAAVRLDNAAPPRAPAPGYYTADQVNALNAQRAPHDATFITQTPNATLTGEQALSALSTGLLYNTTGTGVLSSVANGTNEKILKMVNGVPTWTGDTTSDSYWHNVVTEYGASGSGNTYTCSMSAVTNPTTLTCTGATDFAASQGVLVAGAGSAGADLVANVVSGAGTTWTLSSPALTTVSGVLVQHDDTEDVQAAINAAHAGGGGTVYFPAGVYRFNRALDATENAVLTIPRINSGNAPQTIIFQGEFMAPTTSAGPAAVTGTVWISDRIAGSGTNPALITGRKSSATTAPQNFSYVLPFFRNIFFRVTGAMGAPGGPSISVLQFHNNMGLQVSYCQFDTGNFADQVEPTHSNSYAILGPGFLNYAQLSLDHVSILGAFYNGVYSGEHMVFGPGVFITRTKQAIVLESSELPVHGQVSVSISNKAIVCNGECYFQDFNLTLERWPASGLWYSPHPTAEIDRTTGVISGVIRYMLEEGGTGAITTGIRTNVPSTSNLLALQRINAGSHFELSDFVLRKDEPSFYYKNADDTIINATQHQSSGGAWDWHFGANTYYAAGWQRVNTGVGSFNFYISPFSRSFAFRQAAAGASVPITWTNIFEGDPSGVKVGGGSYVKGLWHGAPALVAGVATVANASTTANARITVTRFTDGGTIGCSYSVTRNAGVGFTITSKDKDGNTQTLDTSTVSYTHIEP